jgi:hypothetical protein
MPLTKLTIMRRCGGVGVGVGGGGGVVVVVGVGEWSTAAGEVDELFDDEL